MRKPFLFLLGLVMLCSGCDRTVTSRDTRLTLAFTITFREAINTDLYTYAIVFAENDPPTLPEIIDEGQGAVQGIYFPLPGQETGEGDQDFRDNELSSFYATYFASWSSFFKGIFNGEFTHIRSDNDAGFPSSATEEEHQAFLPDRSADFTSTLSQSNTTLKLTINADNLFGTDLTGTRYFSIITIKRSEPEEAGYLMDKSRQESVISLPASEELLLDFSGLNEVHSFLDGPSDILSWSVRVF